MSPFLGRGDLLSQRAMASTRSASNTLWDILADSWDPSSNPGGIVSSGVADNTLMHHELLQHVNENFMATTRHLALDEVTTGSTRLRIAMARFLNRKLKPSTVLQEDHIRVTNGVTAAVEHCSWALCDPGDGFLVGRPYYRGFTKDIALRPGVELVPVSFGEVDPVSTAAVKKYEEAVLEAKAQNVRIRAIMICNPHNPLGTCYTKAFWMGLMVICEKHEIHIVSDELYALSVWGGENACVRSSAEFISILAISTAGLIDPRLVHMVWGVSKDFGANGVRLGCLISQANTCLLEAVQIVGQYTSASGVADAIFTPIFEDDCFVDRYIELNHEKLRDSFSCVVSFCENYGIPYAQGINAALFVWCDLLTPYLMARSTSRYQVYGLSPTAAKKQLLQNLARYRIHLGDGEDFACEKPGWFRITFSQPRYKLEEGLKRLLAAIRT